MNNKYLSIEDQKLKYKLELLDHLREWLRENSDASISLLEVLFNIGVELLTTNDAVLYTNAEGLLEEEGISLLREEMQTKFGTAFDVALIKARHTIDTQKRIRDQSSSTSSQS